VAQQQHVPLHFLAHTNHLDNTTTPMAMQQDSGTDGRIHWHIATGGEMHAALFTAVRNTPALHLLLSSNELQCALISPCLVLSVHQPNSLDVTLTRLVCV
jgi:hypothetical protein